MTEARLQIANICNSTIIEIYGDIIRVSLGFRLIPLLCDKLH
jgi:hypothetical protein